MLPSHGIWLNRRTQVRKIGLFELRLEDAPAVAVIAALTLLGVGGWMEWVTADSQARVATLAGDPVDPTQLTMTAKDLPVAKFVDYTLEFPEQ
jgi:hypothetical protein